MKCDIIIPIWNQLFFTKDCIDNILNNTHYPYRLILVDNGSDDETRGYLESLKREAPCEIDLIRNEKNLGFVKAVNQGLRISTNPFICVLNNDTVPAPGWLEKMVDFANTYKDVGLINPQCSGHLSVPIKDYAKELEKRRGEYMEMNQCQGFCMLVKRELIEKIGRLDESFAVGGFDDTDYSMRAHLAGYRCVSIKDAYVYHHLHVSFNKAGDREKWVKRNQGIYYKKWGKHLRIGLIVVLKDSDYESISRAFLLAYGMARGWSWVHIWINYRGDKDLVLKNIEKVMHENGLAPHQNIRVEISGLAGHIFTLKIIGKLLGRMRKRMKDKRFDAVLTFDNGSANFIPPIARLAGTRFITLSLEEETQGWLKAGSRIAADLKRERDAGTVV